MLVKKATKKIEQIARTFLFVFVVLFSCTFLFFPVSTYAVTTSYTSAGSTSFSVPYYTTLTAQVWGGGGGGGAASPGDVSNNVSSSAGGQSSFNNEVYGNGGSGGGKACGTNCFIDAASGGSGGSASGGDTNTTGTGGQAGQTSAGGNGGAGANGGAGGAGGVVTVSYGNFGSAGTAPGGGGGGGGFCRDDGYGNCNGTKKRAGGGGGGGYSSKTYSPGDLTAGASVSVVVGNYGNRGYINIGGGAPQYGSYGGNGSVGRVTLTYTLDTTAPTPNAMTFATAPDDASASSIDMISTTGSDLYSIEYSFAYTACASNPGTGGTSSGWQGSTSYTDTGLQVNKCYGYTVQARDAAGNTGTASAASEAYTAANTPSAPTLGTPTATTLTLTHAENSNPTNTTFAVQILNASPADATWDDQYVDASGDPSASEVWLTDAQLDGLVINGLNGSTYYEARSKARNGDGDETAFSATGSDTTVEADPPTPDPMTFATAPDDVSTTSIDMLATTASDASTPVEYNFTYSACAQDAGTGGISSGWQVSSSYTDIGLDTNQCYAYEVQARDAVGNTNATSAIAKAYTSADVPGAPNLFAPSAVAAVLSHDNNANPATTTFAVQLLNSSPSDASWDAMYVDASGYPSASEVWLTQSQLNGLVVRGLTSGTYYDVRSKARNGDGDETAFSATGNTTTEETNNVSRINLYGNVRLQGVRFQ